MNNFDCKSSHIQIISEIIIKINDLPATLVQYWLSKIIIDMDDYADHHIDKWFFTVNHSILEWFCFFLILSHVFMFLHLDQVCTGGSSPLSCSSINFKFPLHMTRMYILFIRFFSIFQSFNFSFSSELWSFEWLLIIQMTSDHLNDWHSHSYKEWFWYRVFSPSFQASKLEWEGMFMGRSTFEFLSASRIYRLVALCM